MTMPATTASPSPQLASTMRSSSPVIGFRARPDGAGYAVPARDDGRMRQQPAAVGDDRTEERQQDVERLCRRLRDEDVALDDPVELRRAGHAAGRSLVHPRAGSEAAQERLLVFRLGAAEQRADRDPSRA